jgi:hypothetical protein
MCPAKTCE